MRITIEIDSKSEMEKLSALLKTFNINAVNVTSADQTAMTLIKGDKKIDPKSLFGIWEDHPQNVDDIRKTAWQRKSGV
jgi:hypothetical protein